MASDDVAVKRTPQMTEECNFGLHQHCPGASHYGGVIMDPQWQMRSMSLPCECACHKRAETPASAPDAE